MYPGSKYIFRLSLLLAVLFSSPLLAISPDQQNMQKMVDFAEKSARYIDVCLTNLPPDSPGTTTLLDKLRPKFKESLLRKHVAKTYLLQGEYSRTYSEMTKSLNLLKEIYKEVLVYYLDSTHLLLEESLPLTIRSDDKFAGHYVKSGYRFLGQAKIHFKRGYNINHKLNGEQINLYQQGIKASRMARRFAVLALIESNLPPVEKDAYARISNDMARRIRSGRNSKRNIYQWKLNKIINLTGRQMMPATVEKNLHPNKSIESLPKKFSLKIIDVHQDNYKYIIAGRDSIRVALLQEVYSQDVKEEPLYPIRNRDNRLIMPRDSETEEEKKSELSEKLFGGDSASDSDSEASQPVSDDRDDGAVGAGEDGASDSGVGSN